jgi:hypothetical protein
LSKVSVGLLRKETALEEEGGTYRQVDSIRTDLRPRALSSMVCVVSTFMTALPSGVTAWWGER